MVMRELMSGCLLLHEHVPPLGRVGARVGREPGQARAGAGARAGRGRAARAPHGPRGGRPGEPRLVIGRRRTHLLMLRAQHLLLLLLQHFRVVLARHACRRDSCWKSHCIVSAVAFRT